MGRLLERIATAWFWLSVLLIGILLLLFVLLLGDRSSTAMHVFSWHFLFSRTWDPVHQIFGALPFLYGTAVTSLFAIIFGGIIGVASAIVLVHFTRGKIRAVLGTLIELLAAIPSVVYGLWGLFVLAPWLQNHGEPFLQKVLGFLPFFKGMPVGVGYLAAGILLSMMIIPTIASVSRDILLVVPRDLYEAGLALGSTKQEAITQVAVPYARTGIVGALMLGLGRAFGETIAVMMVIGNRPEITASLFQPGYTMASVIANEFTEATSKLYVSSLYEVGLLLLIVTILFFGAARLLVWRVTNGRKGRFA